MEAMESHDQLHWKKSLYMRNNKGKESVNCMIAYEWTWFIDNKEMEAIESHDQLHWKNLYLWEIIKKRNPLIVWSLMNGHRKKNFLHANF